MSDHPSSAPSIGACIVPDATGPTATLGQIVAADETHLDLVAVNPVDEAKPHELPLTSGGSGVRIQDIGHHPGPGMCQDIGDRY